MKKIVIVSGVFLLFFLTGVIGQSIAENTGNAQCSRTLESEPSKEDVDTVCNENQDTKDGDLDVQSKWENMKNDKSQQAIKEKCNCENDPKVLKEDGETTYFYRLIQCRSKCKL